MKHVSSTHSQPRHRVHRSGNLSGHAAVQRSSGHVKANSTSKTTKPIMSRGIVWHSPHPRPLFVQLVQNDHSWLCWPACSKLRVQLAWPVEFKRPVRVTSASPKIRKFHLEHPPARMGKFRVPRESLAAAISTAAASTAAQAAAPAQNTRAQVRRSTTARQQGSKYQKARAHSRRARRANKLDKAKAAAKEAAKRAQKTKKLAQPCAVYVGNVCDYRRCSRS